MKIRDILKENNAVSGTTNVYGPYKVTAFDPNTQVVNMDGHEDITLSASIKDKPRPGFNYAFELNGNTAVRLILLTADNVITTGKEVLLIKRKNQPFAGFWALPGGFIDPGETPEQAARRELEEEAGMQLNVPMKFIGKFFKPGRDPRMNDVWSYAYLAKVSKDTITAGDDASDAQWVPISKLDELNLAFDHADIIEKSMIKKQATQGVAEGSGLDQEAGIGIDGQSFKFKIKDLVAFADKYPVTSIDPTQFKKQIEDRDEDPAESMDRAKKAELKYPIIVVKRKNGQLWIADGTHRAHKAILNNVSKINAKVIPIEDMSKFSVKQGVAEAHHGQSCPHCGGEMVSEEQLTEKKDACYYKVKSRYKVWPSAYASGALVKCRKKGAANWGKSKK